MISYCSELKHFNITASVLWLPNQFREHCQSKQQPLRGEIFKILGERGERCMGGLNIWLIICTNGKNMVQGKYEYYCFSLDKLRTYLNQINNLKQTGIYSKKYMLLLIFLHSWMYFVLFFTCFLHCLVSLLYVSRNLH